MNKFKYTSISLCILLTIICVSSSKFKYPDIRRNESVVDDYFATKVSDPYRWLEDVDSNETKEFVHAENEVTTNYFIQAPSRTEINKTLTKFWTYPRVGLPKKRGENYFVYKTDGVKSQWTMYKSKTVEDLLKDDAEVFLDPNAFSKDGTTALSKVAFSKNGELMAYTLSESGSDWSHIHIKNVSSGKDFDEVLKYSKFPSIEWTHDHLGFFYNRYPPPKPDTEFVDANTDEKIYYHRVGTPQEKDTLMIEFPDKRDWGVALELSDDGEYIIVSVSKVVGEDYLYFAKITDEVKNGLQDKIKVLPITEAYATYSFIGNDGPRFYFVTNQGAPNYRFVAVDLNKPEVANWETLIPEHSKDVLSWATTIDNDKMFISYNQDVKSTLELRYLNNASLITSYPLEAGSIQSTEGRREDKTFYFQIATFTNPGVTYKLTFNKSGEIPKELEFFSKTAFSGLDTSEYETKQVFYKSKDGTNVPMFIVQKKGHVLNGTAPTLMYGYGGFQSSTEPFFSAAFLSFVYMFNGILAFPNIRGGGEYGTSWWDQGRLFNKQTVFDDFAAAGEYLIRENYTNPSKLAIKGSSNGGLLIGACANQRPELYGAGIADVGVMDMLRFQKFTVGKFWCGEYGCSEDPKHFANLITYSPLHNIRENTTYPAMLVTTADHDDRVVPSHSFKYIAQLQHIVGNYINQTQPLMIRIAEKAGHGHGKPTYKQIEEYVDQYSFLQLALNYTFAA